MNDVMRVLKEEGCSQSAHDYSDNMVSVEITFRAAASDTVAGRLGKIEGLTSGWLRTV